jgi:hypothetical protein
MSANSLTDLTPNDLNKNAMGRGAINYSRNQSELKGWS